MYVWVHSQYSSGMFRGNASNVQLVIFGLEPSPSLDINKEINYLKVERIISDY